MRAAFVLFDRLTSLDLVGLYDPITRLRSMGFRPDFSWEFCALQHSVSDDRGFVIQVSEVGKSLQEFDLLIVPGGNFIDIGNILTSSTTANIRNAVQNGLNYL